jgi:RNA polymerase sigma-70 factor (ECF subfamily)
VAPEVADAELIAAARHDKSAFAVLYDRHARQLYRYVFRRVGREVAEDVVAEAFLAAFRGLDRYDISRPDARAWLFGIVTKQLARYHRTERARYRALARAASEPAVIEFAERVDGYVSAAAAGPGLASALARLARRDRDVLLLVAWGELTYEEVAAVLSIPVGTVRSRLNRARRRMRDMLRDNDVEVAP